MKKFATRLKELRLEEKLSQEELAAATGLTQVAITYWENEKRIPNLKAVITLARYFNVSLDYLAGEKDY
ncbi:MAG: helix-turn-helix transcriptional regulator [Clostridia bacterium]|nr:helix-turn-helix transcriptional regulator [Clostridia bacterium]